MAILTKEQNDYKNKMLNEVAERMTGFKAFNQIPDMGTRAQVLMEAFELEIIYQSAN